MSIFLVLCLFWMEPEGGPVQTSCNVASCNIQVKGAVCSFVLFCFFLGGGINVNDQRKTILFFFCLNNQTLFVFRNKLT